MMDREGWAMAPQIVAIWCVGCEREFQLLAFEPVPDDWRCPHCDYWWDRRN